MSALAINVEAALDRAQPLTDIRNVREGALSDLTISAFMLVKVLAKCCDHFLQLIKFGSRDVSHRSVLLALGGTGHGATPATDSQRPEKGGGRKLIPAASRSPFVPNTIERSPAPARALNSEGEDA